LAAEFGEPVLYVATARALDAEMAERIERHRQRRPVAWRTLEAPSDIGRLAALQLGDAHTVLLEDLTLLLSNLFERGEAEANAARELDRLLELSAHVILVSNEVGMGLVPDYPLGRAFRDALGRLNQRAAAAVGEVYFVVAGMPLRLR
jgi:adenosylcobinamide kinase/adenosylcobinamide-phosphate guanylyltransferase